ncbi:MAG: hypothetical protein EZS28_014771 [Streblomastix strix]|uniref:Uncharacterized protein n=1 Tax=Streblomastix strix TaxID=222440 RepID=A0A5J4W589_9EUKA|nr:MAG: hypothetical protein EZS28_014771 [Streblomastix strix]
MLDAKNQKDDKQIIKDSELNDKESIKSDHNPSMLQLSFNDLPLSNFSFNSKPAPFLTGSVPFTNLPYKSQSHHNSIQHSISGISLTPFPKFLTEKVEGLPPVTESELKKESKAKKK